MMSVVWENSSDVIGLSIQKSTGDVVTLLSPTFLKLYAKNWNFKDLDNTNKEVDETEFLLNSNIVHSSKGAAFELDAKYFTSNIDLSSGNSNIIPSNVFEVEFGSNLHSFDANFSNKDDASSMNSKASKEDLVPISELVVKAWQSRNGTNMLLHDLDRVRDNVKETIRCEANITKLEENALVIVVRNISERFHRFEAEKKAVSETTARMKDAAANRFTRHEVKNGLLAAIGICDSLKESVFKGVDSQGEFDNHGKRSLLELDIILHEILETVLAETMARDVIHEVYAPKQERVSVVELIQNTMNVSASAANRFPVVTEPSPFPDLALDPQLLKYIHRNAMSNACKYGKQGGEVLTDIKFDDVNGMLQLNVVNLPGNEHDEILKLGSMASEMIFSPSRRLSIHSVNDSTHSSGDGAWVMLKCAKTLGGHCDIKVCKVMYPSTNNFLFYI